MDGDRSGCGHIRQGAAIVSAVLFIRVCYVEPGYRAAGAHIRLHAETETRRIHVEPNSKREADAPSQWFPAVGPPGFGKHER